jgi:hypothetical protein
LLLPIPTIGQGWQSITWSPEITPHKWNQERKAARLLVQMFFILFRSVFIDFSSQNQALLLSYGSICKQFSCYIIIYVYTCQLELYLSVIVSILCCLMISKFKAE